MTRQQIASSSLLTTTAALALNKGSPASLSAPASAEKFQEWELRRITKGGQDLWMLRFERSQPKVLFARLVIELNWISEDRMLGVLVLPPGLDATAGVRFQLNDGPFTETTAFSASGPAGSVVKLDIGPEALQQMREARRFNILTQPAASKQQLLFSIPLDGFAAGGERLKEINHQLSS